MATIILTIPDNQIAEITTSFDVLFPGRTTETKGDWAKLRVADYVRDIVRRYRLEESHKTISQTVVDIS